MLCKGTVTDSCLWKTVGHTSQRCVASYIKCNGSVGIPHLHSDDLIMRWHVVSIWICHLPNVGSHYKDKTVSRPSYIYDGTPIHEKASRRPWCLMPNWWPYGQQAMTVYQSISLTSLSAASPTNGEDIAYIPAISKNMSDTLNMPNSYWKGEKGNHESNRGPNKIVYILQSTFSITLKRKEIGVCAITQQSIQT